MRILQWNVSSLEQVAIFIMRLCFAVASLINYDLIFYFARGAISENVPELSNIQKLLLIVEDSRDVRSVRYLS